MLSKCAPGHTIEDRPHRRWVSYNGKTYRDLPNGGHGKRDTYDIPIHKVRNMSDVLGIEECCKRFLSY